MTIKEYNKDFLPKLDHAYVFIHSLEHAMEKTNDYEEAIRQLKCIGWSDELKDIIRTALGYYRKFVLENEIKMI